MVLEGDAVDGRFHRRIQQLDDQHEDQAGDEQRTLDAGIPEPQRERGEQDDEDQLDAERILVPRRCGEPRERVARCVEDPA